LVGLKVIMLSGFYYIFMMFEFAEISANVFTRK
jgi:hypothetical protein